MLTPKEKERKEYLIHTIGVMEDQLSSLHAKERKNKRLAIKLFFTYIRNGKSLLLHLEVWKYFWFQAKENAVWNGVEYWDKYWQRNDA